MAETKKATAAKTQSCYCVTCKAGAVSEQVAIAEAIAEKLAGRNLATLKQNRDGNISTTDIGATRDIAAAKAGAKPPS